MSFLEVYYCMSLIMQNIMGMTHLKIVLDFLSLYLIENMY